MGQNSTTTGGDVVAQTNVMERGWNKDMPAYKRLRKEGLRPRNIDGSALLEKHANARWQVEGTPPTSG